MGAGFYDRYFAFLRTRPASRRPQLIGIAYSFQQVVSLTPQPWDVPLDAVVTEKGWVKVK
jgi:5-formyltetrahydrofolate cyclo-ligase